MRYLIITVAIWALSFNSFAEDVLQFDHNRLSQYSDQEAKVWILYGLKLYECIKPEFIQTFSCEVSSRSEAAKYWRKIGTSSEYLDELVQVEKKGFMEEYVAYYFKGENWDVPSNLKMVKFEKWLRNNLPNHKPILNPGIAFKIKDS